MSERRRGIWLLTTSARYPWATCTRPPSSTAIRSTTVPGPASGEFHGRSVRSPSNIGRYDRNVFATIPEVNAQPGRAGHALTRATIGYSMMYINHVAQAGNQINLNVDPAQISGGSGTSPSFSWHQNSYWLQGINFGLDFTF